MIPWSCQGWVCAPWGGRTRKETPLPETLHELQNRIVSHFATWTCHITGIELSTMTTGRESTERRIYKTTTGVFDILPLLRGRLLVLKIKRLGDSATLLSSFSSAQQACIWCPKVCYHPLRVRLVATITQKIYSVPKISFVDLVSEQNSK